MESESCYSSWRRSQIKDQSLEDTINTSWVRWHTRSHGGGCVIWIYKMIVYLFWKLYFDDKHMIFSFFSCDRMHSKMYITKRHKSCFYKIRKKINRANVRRRNRITWLCTVMIKHVTHVRLNGMKKIKIKIKIFKRSEDELYCAIATEATTNHNSKFDNLY